MSERVRGECERECEGSVRGSERGVGEGVRGEYECEKEGAYEWE